MPPLKLSRGVDNLLDVIFEKTFLTSGIAKYKTDFVASDIRLRSFCFIEELKKRKIEVEAMRTLFGYNNQFRIKINNIIFRFETLPIINPSNAAMADDKESVKCCLKENNLPIADGRSFWLWQKKEAIKFGIKLGYPLIVKPRVGSASQHVTTNILDENQLEKAIKYAATYSPAFIIEKFIPDTFVFRATVVDFNFVVVVQQIPANITGDGKSTIRQLIDSKNSDRENENKLLYKITENEMTKELLKDKKYNYSTILKKNELLFLQKDPFLKLGGDLMEVTKAVHRNNLKLFKDVAKLFNIHLVGIDFLAKDISVSWQEQTCAILELNNMPCIELHHFPSSGVPTNPAKAVADMFFKYFVNK